ncbi:S8 family serine peptidase [Alteromonas sp. 5E99-2]|uniref:S8 family peptidase n=1 Tax=Alteromonas sp. 5E99-2 TaxID=2817683 RepID=UPI001A98E5B1|nr:S8 family serine peptidase [Alteromonas sp. 5E99-2]MBO1255944.1 S8 family serine peptidase [Alteromonas sp. 5E99-2]
MSNLRLTKLCKFCFIVVISMVGQSCATSSKVKQNSVALESLNHPMLVVIDDPRSERDRRGLGGVLYGSAGSYEDAPVLARVTNEIASDYQLIVASQWPLKSLGVHCFVIEMPTADVLSKLEQDERIKWVQPFNEYQLQGSAVDDHQSSVEKSNGFPVLPHKGKGVNILVIDTGADINHPALSSTNLRYKNFVRNKGNGHDESHGTAVTGLIAAMPYNDNSVVKGFAPEADIHHFRGCWQDDKGKGKCNTLTLALALDEAVSLEPDLINLSLTGPADPILDEILNKLIAKGTLVISAYDESRSQTARFPKAQKGVVFAFGIDPAKNKVLPQDSIFAPAHALSLAPQGQYDVFVGHSIATPQLTAMAACVKSADPKLSHLDMVNHMKQWFTGPPVEEATIL